MLVRVQRHPISRSFISDLGKMERNLDGLFGSLVNGSDRVSSPAFPVMDIAENEQETTVIAELPGVKREDVKISVEKDTLTVYGKRDLPSLPEKSRWLRNETASGEFSRTFTLSHLIEADKVSAELTNGVLRITLPKPEAVRPKEIMIR